MPGSTAYDVLLKAARALHQNAQPHAALFIEFEMPATFLADLQEDIDTLANADDTQDDGFSQQVSGTAVLAAEMVKGIKARNQLMPMVKNKFRGNPGVLAEWSTASRIVRPNRMPATPPQG